MRTAPPVLKDGVHLHLPEDDYFAAPALGTTDLTKLWQFKRGWWWQSRHNPRNDAAPTKAMTFGRAMHTRLLEGRAAFELRFAIEPEPESYEGLLRTVDDIKSALEADGHPLPGTKAKKSDFVEYAKLYLPHRPSWDAILELFHKARGDREAISAQEAEEIELMAQLALEEPNLKAVMVAEDGVQLSEVSVLWTTPDGIRLRYRFDALVPSGNVDLKAIGNAAGRVEEAAAQRIRDYHLEIQLAQSFEARRRAYEFIKAGKIYGGSKDERAWLKLFPKRAPLDDGTRAGWAWLWVFYQRPDSKGGRAPTILPLVINFGEELHREGWRKITAALATYREALALFGLDKPWTQLLPTHATSGTSKHQLPLRPAWGELPGPAPDEEAALSWRSQP